MTRDERAFVPGDGRTIPGDAGSLLSVCGDPRTSEVVDQSNTVVSFHVPRIVVS